MRKIILNVVLSVTMLLIGQSILAQGKQAQRAQTFADKAAEKFDLDAEATSKVYEIQLAKIKQNAKLTRQVKNSEITKEQKKASLQAYQADFLNSMAEATGKSKKDIRTFLKEFRQEQKKGN